VSGVLYGGVPEELVALGWVVASLLVAISVSSSFVAMARRADVLPRRVYEVNQRHGWPGRSAMENRGFGRVLMVIFGFALLALVLLVPIWSLVDSTIRIGVIVRVLLAVELALLGSWVAYLALRWKSRDGLNGRS
jgi:cytochrome c biogenesis protein CcdA